MHTIILILIFAILAIQSVSGQTLTRILRDEINGNNMRTEALISSSEATVDADADSVPYVGGPNQWRVPLSNGTGFTTPTFLLDNNTVASPTYAIFAIEIQNNLTDGACNRQSSQLTRIELADVRIGLVGTESSVNVSSYRDGSGLMDFERMGLTNENNHIRFNIPHMDGDIVQFKINKTNPDFNNPTPLDVCLQVEFLGARISMGSPDPPSINESPLLQYNMNRPGISYLGNSYDDLAYSGVRGSLYTGGVGVLTDGIIGTDPRSNSTEWVGFSRPGGVRLFLNRKYPISAIEVIFWMEAANFTVAPTGGAQDETSQLSQFTFTTAQYEGMPGLHSYRGTSGSSVMLDYLEIPLSTTQSILITEILLLDGSYNLINTSAVTINISPTSSTTTPGTSITPGFSQGASSITENSQGASTSRGPLTTSQPLPLDTIVFLLAGVVVCCFILFIIMAVTILLLVVAFVYLRNSKRTRINKKRSLPPPPGSGEEREKQMKDDYYLQIDGTIKPNLSIDTTDRRIKPMRTISEDGYMSVTPPPATYNTRYPLQSNVSATYVTVTPPGSPGNQLTQIEDDKYESIALPEIRLHTIESQNRTSSDNEYV